MAKDQQEIQRKLRILDHAAASDANRGASPARHPERKPENSAFGRSKVRGRIN